MEIRPIPSAIAATGPTHARTETRARRRRVSDEPPARNGSDLGCAPMETLLPSLLGCTNVIANKIAEEMDILIGSMAKPA